MTPEDLELIKQAIADEFAKLRRDLELPTSADADDCEWLPTAQAYKSLGFVNAEQLRDRVRLGDFKLGHHYRDVRLPGRTKANYQFHVKRCQELLNQPPSQRKNQKERKHEKAA